MNISKTDTIGEIAARLPSAIRLFEKLNIDYCCGGKESLEEACRERGLAVGEVSAALDTLQEVQSVTPDSVDWTSRPLTELIDNIVKKHHAYVRAEIPRLDQLINKICQAHGEKRPEMLEVRSLLGEISAEMTQHMQKEEVILFPFIEQLEAAVAKAQPAPFAPFGSVENPIHMMIREHDDAGNLIQSIQSKLTDRSGCPTCQEFFRSIDAFEKDLHQHIHKENNILFPRSLELEKEGVRA